MCFNYDRSPNMINMFVKKKIVVDSCSNSEKDVKDVLFSAFLLFIQYSILNNHQKTLY